MTDERRPPPRRNNRERNHVMSFKPALSLLKASKLGALWFAGAAAVSLAGCGTDYISTPVAAATTITTVIRSC